MIFKRDMLIFEVMLHVKLFMLLMSLLITFAP